MNSLLNNLFSVDLSKWVSRKDIMRVVATDPDTYLSVNVHTQDGLIAYVDPADMGTIHYGDSSKLDGMLPIFSVTELTYGSGGLDGMRVLDNVKRFFEHRDRVFVVVDRNDDDTLVARRWLRKDVNGYHVTNEFLSISEADTVRVIGDVVNRLNGNKLPIDQRKAEWDGALSNYGLYRQQQAADRAERAARKA